MHPTQLLHCTLRPMRAVTSSNICGCGCQVKKCDQTATFYTWTRTLCKLKRMRSKYNSLINCSIYEYETRLGDSMPDGSKLGEFKDEYPKKEITAYYALGPKAYVLELTDPVTKKVEIVKRCRGIQLNYMADNQLNFDRICEMVENAGRFSRDYNCEEVENRDKNFRITPQGNIFSTPMVKRVRPTYYKGVLRGHRIVPFGYVHNPQ